MDAIFGNKQISKREFEIIAEKNVYVPMRDGTKIGVNVFRPDSKKKFPALVGISAANVDIQSERIWPSAARSSRVRGTPTVGIESAPKEFFVRRGYVQIIGSARGSGKSEGVYQRGSIEEIKDIYDLIEWAARQPWCNGNVGMASIAEYAAVEPQVAAMQPPHLKAIAPISSFWDEYRYFWWIGGLLANGFLKWSNNLINKDIHTDISVLLSELGEKGFKAALERALADKDIIADPGLVEILRNPFALGHAAMIDILLHPTMCPYWEDRGAKIDLTRIEIPAYFGVVSHRPGPMYRWADLKMPKKMIYLPPAYLDRPFYQLSWELLRWFDYWLKGMDSGIMDEPTVRIFVQGSNDWLNSTDFPIPGTKWIPFNLHENQSLCEIEPWPDAESRSYDDSPVNRGSLKYYSAPMVENTEVVGLSTLNLYASCRGTDMNLLVSLWDCDSEGNETCLNRGYLKASHRELDPRCSKPWHPVLTNSNPKPVVPGRVYKLSIGFGPVANSFKVGHRIMLKISSADDDPDNLFQVGMYHLCSQTPNTITVYHNAQYPSHLLLPITRGNIIGTYVSGGDISLKNKEFMKLK
jgi:predicted acyl esterase